MQFWKLLDGAMTRCLMDLNKEINFILFILTRLRTKLALMSSTDTMGLKLGNNSTWSVLFMSMRQLVQGQTPKTWLLLLVSENPKMTIPSLVNSLVCSKCGQQDFNTEPSSECRRMWTGLKLKQLYARHPLLKTQMNHQKILIESDLNYFYKISHLAHTIVHKDCL